MQHACEMRYLVRSPFIGSYLDPNHKTGYRHVTVENGICKIVGRDRPERPEWVFEQPVKGGQLGTEMVVDFSPKGGPKDLLAKWDGKRNGIAFPDGNLWQKLS